ncbi:MAG: peptidoglycan-binding protein [Candidatus Taylorbacteria bacterium]|nr:peptidoglycan-binding protein [Candidatus Taylorbacteria bacterium]
MKKFGITLCLGILALLSPALTSAADTPAIVSFNVPTSLESGQVASFAWTINGGGHSFIIFCSQGIKLKYVSTNKTFPCDVKTAISPAASDGISLIVANVSGNPRILTVRLIPKDGSGVEYLAGASEVPIYVNPSRQPITIFYTNATTTVSGAATTFYWTTLYLDGVNLRIACNDMITATSSTYGVGVLPCGRTIFPADLPGSGSVTVKFKNVSPTEIPLDVTLFPAMSPGVYDGTRALTINLLVASDAQKPIALSYFTASRQKIFSGDSVSFSWSFLNGSGVNLKLSCAPSVTYSSFTAATTTSLPCDTYGWPNPLSPTGSTSVTFSNSGTSGQTSTISIFPQRKDLTYDGSQVASVKINVEPAAKVAPPSAPSAVASTPAVSTSSPTAGFLGAATTKPAGAPISLGGKNIFKRPLDIGSRGDDVRLLQIFLAKDKSVYPEGYATGYFGPITARAVGRFQLKYGLVKSSRESGYGFVGPKTRTLLNSLQ